MDDLSINKDILRIHGYISTLDEDSGSGEDSKWDLDARYKTFQPSPIQIDPKIHKIIEIDTENGFQTQKAKNRKSYLSVLKSNNLPFTDKKSSKLQNTEGVKTSKWARRRFRRWLRKWLSLLYTEPDLSESSEDDYDYEYEDEQFSDFSETSSCVTPGQEKPHVDDVKLLSRTQKRRLRKAKWKAELEAFASASELDVNHIDLDVGGAENRQENTLSKWTRHKMRKKASNRWRRKSSTSSSTRSFGMEHKNSQNMEVEHDSRVIIEGSAYHYMDNTDEEEEELSKKEKRRRKKALRRATKEAAKLVKREEDVECEKNLREADNADTRNSKIDNIEENIITVVEDVDLGENERDRNDTLDDSFETYWPKIFENLSELLAVFDDFLTNHPDEPFRVFESGSNFLTNLHELEFPITNKVHRFCHFISEVATVYEKFSKLSNPDELQMIREDFDAKIRKLYENIQEFENDPFWDPVICQIMSLTEDELESVVVEIIKIVKLKFTEKFKKRGADFRTLGDSQSVEDNGTTTQVDANATVDQAPLPFVIVENMTENRRHSNFISENQAELLNAAVGQASLPLLVGDMIENRQHSYDFCTKLDKMDGSLLSENQAELQHVVDEGVTHSSKEPNYTPRDSDWLRCPLLWMQDPNKVKIIFIIFILMLFKKVVLCLMYYLVIVIYFILSQTDLIALILLLLYLCIFFVINF